MSPEILRLVTELDERLRAEAKQAAPGLRLPFDGSLSEGEQRMLEQHAFDDPQPQGAQHGLEEEAPPETEVLVAEAVA